MKILCFEYFFPPKRGTFFPLYSWLDFHLHKIVLKCFREKSVSNHQKSLLDKRWYFLFPDSNFLPLNFFPLKFSLWMLTVLNGPPQCKFIQIYSIQKGAEHTYVRTLNFTHSSMLKTLAHISPSISDSLFKSCSLAWDRVCAIFYFTFFFLSRSSQMFSKGGLKFCFSNSVFSQSKKPFWAIKTFFLFGTNFFHSVLSSKSI